MQTINCYIPLKLRLRGEPGEDDWANLEEALVARYSRTLKRSIAELTRSRFSELGMLETVAEPFAPERMGPEGYLIPSYDNGKPKRVPALGIEAAGASTSGTLTIDLTVTEIKEWIRDYFFPGTKGRPRSGVYYGLYVTLRGTDSPRLYYLNINEQGQEVLESIFLYIENNKQKKAMLLQEGSYTVIFRPFGKGIFSRGSQREGRSLDNPDNMDLAVNFVVPFGQGVFEGKKVHYTYRFYPRMGILETNHESIMAVGSESIYYADVQIWGIDKSGQEYRESVLAFVFASLDYTWEIWKLKTPPGKKSPVLRELVRSVHTRDEFLRHTWAEEGMYEISCEVKVRHENVSPEPVKDWRYQRVVTLERKMTGSLIKLEEMETEGKFGEAPLWFKSALEMLAFYDKQLKEETNEARKSLLKDAIAKMQRHLYGIEVEKRIPLHAIFEELRTSKVRPITLFLAPSRETDPDNPHVWYLIDLTYPGSYRTYKGKGQTAHEAIAAAFEDARTSFRGNYPPGHILAHIEWPGMEHYGLEPWDFITPTESWERTAYEWASTAVAVVGAVGLAAAFVFPPSAVLAKVVLISGIIGAGLSAANIIERIRTDDFDWDVETFSDIANIAAAFAGVGAAAAQSKAASLSSAIAKGELMTVEAGSKLAKVLTFQRYMLYTSLASDIANGLILSYDTYLQLSTLDKAYDEETRKEYKRLYGDDGYKRWREERYMRILGLLARAAVKTTLLVISARSTGKQIGELGKLQRSLGAGESEMEKSQRKFSVEPETEPPAESPAPASELDIDRLVREGLVDEGVLKKLSIQSWAKGGGDSPVKVVSVRRGASPRVRGYLTTRKYIEGRTPAEMEQILGLPSGELTSPENGGAVVMELEQIPSEKQFGLRGYTQRPGGTAPIPGGKYPPGLGAPQWELVEEVPARTLRTVKPGETFRIEAEIETMSGKASAGMPPVKLVEPTTGGPPKPPIEPPSEGGGPPKPPTEPAVKQRATEKTRPKGSGSKRASAQQLAAREAAEAKRLTPLEQGIRDSLMAEHELLNREVATQAAKDGVSVTGRKGHGGDIRLRNGQVREVTVHIGKFDAKAIGGHIVDKTRQGGEIFIQISSAGFTQDDFRKLIPDLLEYGKVPDFKGKFVKIFGDDGKFWWQHQF